MPWNATIIIRGFLKNKKKNAGLFCAKRKSDKMQREFAGSDGLKQKAASLQAAWMTSLADAVFTVCFPGILWAWWKTIAETRGKNYLHPQIRIEMRFEKSVRRWFPTIPWRRKADSIKCTVLGCIPPAP